MNFSSKKASGRSEEELRKAANAERDLEAYFKRCGLSLPIKIHSLTHDYLDGTWTTEYTNASEWLQTLLRKFPYLIAGGKAPLQEQLAGFWELYRFSHPTHRVFEAHSNHLGRVIPLNFYGDEGSGPRRAGYLEATIETPLGLDERQVQCTCAERLEDLPRHWLPPDPADIQGLSDATRTASMIDSNYPGHSYLHRYLLFGIAGFMYDECPTMVQNHLKVVASDLEMLFNQGIVHNGETYFAALIGSKGDMKFQAHAVAPSITRSYSNLGKKNCIEMCSICLAGRQEYPMEDMALEPVWARSLFESRPWTEDNPPPLSTVPFDDSRPEYLYRLDFFHVWKVGVGRDVCGSTIMFLVELGAFDFGRTEPKNLPIRLKRAFGSFKLWCSAERKSPALRSFTKQFLNAPTSSHPAWSNSKGSDTMLLSQWLFWLLSILGQDPPARAAPHLEILALMKEILHHSIQMCQVIFQHGLWLPRPCAQRLYLHVMVVCRGYKRVAKYLVDSGFVGYRLKPKLHALAHIGYELRQALLSSAPVVLSPVAFACEQNEDHVGRVARLSRILNTRTLGLRLSQRYFLKSRALFRREGARRRGQRRKT